MVTVQKSLTEAMTVQIYNTGIESEGGGGD